MKSTITLIPDERVVSIFKKVAGSFSNKFSSQLLEIVLNSLKSKYIEKYLQVKSIEDVEKVDEQLSSEINTVALDVVLPQFVVCVGAISVIFLLLYGLNISNVAILGAVIIVCASSFPTLPLLLILVG